jgi:arsenate reductase-like glutaredoxin family protein
MKKIYYLSTCSTNNKILSQIDTSDFEMIDIKKSNITPDDLDFIAAKEGGYEAIFSKRAMKYRGLGLNTMNLSERDYRKYMLEEYTFLKRPFIINGDKVYVGNSKKVVEKLIADLG